MSSEHGEGRREKGEGRREKGEGRREKGNWWNLELGTWNLDLKGGPTRPMQPCQARQAQKGEPHSKDQNIVTKHFEVPQGPKQNKSRHRKSRKMEARPSQQGCGVTGWVLFTLSS